MKRRNFFGSLVSVVAAVFVGRNLKAEAKWKPLDTGPETLCFKLNEGRWSQIPWFDMRPGDDVISICVESGCLKKLERWKPGSVPVGESGAVEIAFFDGDGPPSVGNWSTRWPGNSE